MSCLVARFVSASLLVAITAASAKADILAYGFYAGAIGIKPSYEAIPLKKNGGTTLAFTTTEPDTVVAVTYNATCLVEANSIYGGVGNVRVMIKIDGVEPETSASYHSFCGVQHPNQAFGSHSRQVIARVRKPGQHKVQVIAIRDDPAVYAAFYSSSILIQD